MKVALILLLMQGCLGAFDTLWYHELKLRLPHVPTARRELRLHALRDFVYAIIFGSLAWATWHGLWAGVFIALLLVEIVVTLRDFIEEGLTRQVPAGERCMHAVMGIVYGAFLANLLPQVFTWMRLPTGFADENYGWMSWLLTIMATGVCLSGLRDLFKASLRPAKTEWFERNRV